MKIAAFVSCAGIAYTEDALSAGELVGRGYPPSCPVWASQNPGRGSMPMPVQMIEVSEAAPVYVERSGRWFGIPEAEAFEHNSERTGVASRGNLGLAVKAAGMKYLAETQSKNVAELAARMTTKPTETK